MELRSSVMELRLPEVEEESMRTSHILSQVDKRVIKLENIICLIKRKNYFKTIVIWILLIILFFFIFVNVCKRWL